MGRRLGVEPPLDGHGKRLCTACSSSSAVISASAVFVASDGASQSCVVSASAASDKSGQSPPSLARKNMTRSRHCFSAFVHGSRAIPDLAMPSASRAVSSLGATGIGRSESTRAPRRRLLRPRRLRLAASKVISRAARCDRQKAPRSRRARAALRKGCGLAPRCRLVRRRRETAGAPAARRRRLWRRGRSPAGTESRSKIAAVAVFGDALRIGKRKQRADA